tara:strand:+ start:1012 stop:1254 length:243 start_codon:yes stop_codon:yes gene_type:complete
MKKLTVIYVFLSLFLFGCTGCLTKQPTIVDRGVDAHKNLIGTKRQGSEAHRAITINWVSKDKAQNVCTKCDVKKSAKHSL